MRVVLLGVAIAAVCGDVTGQDKNKDYKALDQDAMKAFVEGKFEEAAKTWRYIHRDYPRSAFNTMKANDPRRIAWENAFYTSILRDGLSQKQARLMSDDPKLRDAADATYADSLDTARTLMAQDGVPKATQDKLIKAATQPLLDALKKSVEKK